MVNLTKRQKNRILDKIEETLSNNPVPHDVKSIVGEHGVFRIRIGSYRALYRVNYQESKIIIFKVDKRSKIYD
ncbi:type II toxin-antitoxin system RelE/ParE family toxin [Candidatus Woesearchaeota archaeon]|nr:type II toxin-antitoxin system RelE/ParE family toxin [Candidatus Woesearchaeota archaeon]